MARDRTFEELWETAPPTTATFEPSQVAALPAAAQRYLSHALAPGAALASAARLRMRGELRLGGAWRPFTAEQVIRWDRGFVWRATVKLRGLPIVGSDRLVDGAGAMRWKLLGVLPIVTAEGPEVARSAAGRLHAEAMWLPSVLLGDAVQWTADDAAHARLTVHAHGEDSKLELTLDADGGLRSFCMRRWGDPGDGAFRDEDFGGVVEEERRFAGVAIPTRMRVGWYFGSERFASEGEFFRVTVEDVAYR